MARAAAGSEFHTVRVHDTEGRPKRPFTVTAHDGHTIDTHTLIIATGARANYLGLPSEDRFKNRGVSACAVCDGALPRFRNQPIVVVGGGDSAVEEAGYLTKFASGVELLVRRDVLRASKIMQDRARSNNKINIRWHSEVDEVLGDDKKGVTGVRVKSNQTGSHQELPAAGLFLAIGHTPKPFLDNQLETLPDRLHQVDDVGSHLRAWMACSRPGMATITSRRFRPPDQVHVRLDASDTWAITD